MNVLLAHVFKKLFLNHRMLSFGLTLLLGAGLTALFANADPGASIQGSPSSSVSTLKIDSTTSKVPAGTLLRIALNNRLDSRITQAGEPFSASLTQDFMSTQGRIILPAGSLIRGRVKQVGRSFLFSQGGSLTLDFDHVVLPTGQLLPLELDLSASNANVNKKGAFYQDPGIGKKVERSVDKGISTFEKITQKGFDTGKTMAGGLGSIVTVPAAVIGGTVAGTAVTGGKSIAAVFGKGESALIEPGDTMDVDFGGSFNIPTAD
jgi:hypothetical protein